MIFVNAIWIAIDIDLNDARSQVFLLTVGGHHRGHHVIAGHACHLVAKNALIIVQAHFVFIFAEIVFGLYFVWELIVSPMPAQPEPHCISPCMPMPGPCRIHGVHQDPAP